MTQLAKVLEAGGLNNWSVSGAFDVAPNVSLGLTLTYVSGSYRYDRTYEEQDRAGVYQTFPYDFDRFTLEEYIEGDISGYNAKFGLMYRVPGPFPAGDRDQDPDGVHREGEFRFLSRGRTLTMATSSPTTRPFESTASGDYDVRTPWVFSLGASVMFGNLVLAGDVEYTDWTQMEFQNANCRCDGTEQGFQDPVPSDGEPARRRGI